MMSPSRPPLECPACGTPMNRHAEKLVEPTGEDDASHVDQVLGGVIEEIYCCPACGTNADRRWKPDPAGS